MASTRKNIVEILHAHSGTTVHVGDETNTSYHFSGASCLQNLGKINPEFHKTRITKSKGQVLAGSYDWIISHPGFQQWLNDDKIRVLWLEGSPGKGKTFVLMGIIDDLLSPLSKLMFKPNRVSFFFCEGGHSPAGRTLRGSVKGPR